MWDGSTKQFVSSTNARVSPAAIRQSSRDRLRRRSAAREPTRLVAIDCADHNDLELLAGPALVNAGRRVPERGAAGLTPYGIILTIASNSPASNARIVVLRTFPCAAVPSANAVAAFSSATSETTTRS